MKQSIHGHYKIDFQSQNFLLLLLEKIIELNLLIALSQIDGRYRSKVDFA